MPKFNVTVPHNLSEDEAKHRLDHFIDALGGESKNQVSDLKQSWEGNQLHFGFKTYGIPLKGVVDIQPSQLQVDGELPFSAMMFKGKIESSIRDFLGKLMGSGQASS